MRHLNDGTSASFEMFDQIARDKGLYQVETVGRGFVGAIRVNDVFNLIERTLLSRPLFLTDAGSSLKKMAEIK